jgi:hypothetical protein
VCSMPYSQTNQVTLHSVCASWYVQCASVAQLCDHTVQLACGWSGPEGPQHIGAVRSELLAVLPHGTTGSIETPYCAVAQQMHTHSHTLARSHERWPACQRHSERVHECQREPTLDTLVRLMPGQRNSASYANSSCKQARRCKRGGCTWRKFISSHGVADRADLLAHTQPIRDDKQPRPVLNTPDPGVPFVRCRQD